MMRPVHMPEMEKVHALHVQLAQLDDNHVL